jgi:hypothetical protein
MHRARSYEHRERTVNIAEWPAHLGDDVMRVEADSRRPPVVRPTTAPHSSTHARTAVSLRSCTPRRARMRTTVLLCSCTPRRARMRALLFRFPRARRVGRERRASRPPPLPGVGNLFVAEAHVRVKLLADLVHRLRSARRSSLPRRAARRCAVPRRAVRAGAPCSAPTSPGEWLLLAARSPPRSPADRTSTKAPDPGRPAPAGVFLVPAALRHPLVRHEVLRAPARVRAARHRDAQRPRVKVRLLFSGRAVELPSISFRGCRPAAVVQGRA